MKQLLRYTLKTLLWIVVGIFMLFAILLIGIQMPPVKQKIVDIAEIEVGKLLNAKLHVDSLTGNFFTHLELTGIVLLSEQHDTVASIQSIKLQYRLLSLINNQIHIKNISINQPYISLEQATDSTWNIAHLLKPSEPDSAPSTFNMMLLFDQITLCDGRLNIAPLDTLIPKKIEALHINLSGYYSTDNYQATIHHIGFRTYHPDLVLQSITASAHGDSQSITLDSLLLQTDANGLKAKGQYCFNHQEKSRIELHTTPIDTREFNVFLPDNFTLEAQPQIDLTAEFEATRLWLNLLLRTKQNTLETKAEYFFDDRLKSTLTLTTTPIHTGEFKAFIPEGITFKVTPTLTLDAELQKGLLNANLNLLEKKQGITVTLEANDLIAYLIDTVPVQVKYQLGVTSKLLDLRHWLGNNEWNYLINGKLTASGQGLDPASMHTHLSAKMTDMILYDKPVEQLLINLNYRAGDIEGDISTKGDFGVIQITPKVQKILTHNPSYQIVLDGKQLNVAPLLDSATYKSNLNLTASLIGSGLVLDKIIADATLNMGQSSLMGYAIDTLDVQLNFSDQNLLINNLHANALLADLKISGNYSLKDHSELFLTLQTDNIAPIAMVAGLDSVTSKLYLTAHLHGIPDSLEASAQTILTQAHYTNSISADTLALNADATIRLGIPYAKAKIDAYKLNIGGFPIDTLLLTATTNTENVALDIKANNSDLAAQIDGIVAFGEELKVIINKLWANYQGYIWNMEDTTYLNIDEGGYALSPFDFISTQKDTISAEGTISMDGNEDFRLQIKRLDIENLMPFFAPQQKISGKIGVDLYLTGVASSPILKGHMLISPASIMDYQIKELIANIGYSNRTLDINLKSTPLDSGHLSIIGYLPFIARLDSMQFEMPEQGHDSIAVHFSMDKLPINIIKLFLPADAISGHLKSNFHVGGTLNTPDISGSIHLIDGGYQLKAYGIDFRDMRADIHFLNDRIVFDTLLIKSHDGNLQGRGSALFDSEIYKAKLHQSEISLYFNQFNPFYHKQYNMRMSGNMELNATKDSVLFGGNITIPKSEIYLPAVLNLMGKTTTEETAKPLLIAELEKENLPDSIIYNLHPETIDIDSTFAFLDNFQGKLKVKIPRNTWIKNNEMRLELSGDVELIKHKQFLEIFGTIDVVRGQYSMLGKVFVIQNGTVSFEGGEEINPKFNIDARYSFRDNERTKHDLDINFTGDLTTPEIKFQYDGASVSEGDAISYILFGTNMSGLASGQQSALNASSINAADLAKTAAASLISSQLTKLLGNTLKVDYIEFKSSNSFDNVSFVVGKYITPKLFVSYEQNIGPLESKDVARYEMRLEYELFKFLFLQLASSSLNNGFDLIFKFDAKSK